MHSILNNELDTICAISTPEGEGAISIIRISGNLALEICSKILKFKRKNANFNIFNTKINCNKRNNENNFDNDDKNLNKSINGINGVDGINNGIYVNNADCKCSENKIKENFSVSYCEPKKFYVCNIYDYFINAVIDEAGFVFMKAPNSYTGEDMAEIYPHGGVFNTRYILELILKSGARLAYNGEFTKRAYLNKKINLIQAEAILDIIKSNSVKSLLIANNELNGQLESKLNIIKDNFLYILASIEALIDFPEEEFKDISKMFLLKSKELFGLIENLINSYKEYMANKQGLNVAIAGKPNAGKSSLLNKFLKKQRAIVSDIPGTTRDYIEESLLLFNKTIKIIDTAGLRISNDDVEKAGIDFTYEIIKKSDIILYLIDITSVDFTSIDFTSDITLINIMKKLGLDEDDLEFINNCDKNKKLIIVFNKIDKFSDDELKEKKSEIFKQIESKFGINMNMPNNNTKDNNKHFVKNINNNNINENISGIFFISTMNDLNIDILKKSLYDLIINIESSLKENIAITTIRQKNLLEKSLFCLNNAINAFNNAEPYEIISIELRDGINFLRDIIGNVSNEDILDTLFKEFCIGK
ncbi:MAG: tRNA uridine-5-carboxymethylaminomethyl(34) synthesis GTPase MnmE [Deltaproteobacteria bacterium]|nr:tRNA uridine-5-carboxymethylaminomethyl(34) synthesis GTPase MnmE [Deltaproteobacteria bacterium]